MTDPKVFTVPELADLLKTSELNVYKAIRAKKLEAFKVGREYRVSQDALERFMNPQRQSVQSSDADGEAAK